MFLAKKLNTGGSLSSPDAQFNYVTMLLHGDGTNGAQNNTFLDSSTNNFTITRNGNTTQGSFSPYGSNWSNFFDGTGDYLSTANNSANLGTGDFNITFWINLTVAPSNGVPATNAYNAASFTNGWYFYTGDGTDLSFGLGNATGAAAVTATVNLIGTWHYIEVTRSGSTLSIYVDGVFATSKTNTNTGTVTGNNTKIGSRYDGTSGFITGYISNFKVVVGTAGNTANYTPPTAPATATTNTSLLTCQSNRFVDNSTNNFTITANGNTSVQRFNPFGASTAYSTSVIGGSGYFDGSGDYLSVADNTAFNLSGGDYTIEAWIYWDGNTSDYRAIIAKRVTGGTTTAWEIFLNISTGTFCFYDGTIRDSNVKPNPNAWSHVAACWNNSTSQINLYINGARVLQTSATNTNQSANVVLGRIYATGGEQYIGYMTDVRVVKGTQVYTGTTYTVPTAPLTAISGTSLLLNYTNGAIYDNAMMNDLETVGNAQISTSVKKYGTGSIYFDGSGDYLSTITSPNLNMETGNWTIECWVYISSRTLRYPLIFGNNNGGYSAGALAIVNSNFDSASYNDRFCMSVKDIMDNPTLVASSTNSLNTWYHLAVVRNGTSLVMYRDGTSVASATISSGIVFNWGKLGSRIGGGNWDGAESYFNGYIDDLRITKGYARYTSTFTPPTAALKDTGPT